MGRKNLDVSNLKKRVEDAAARMEEVNEQISKKMTRKIMREHGIESYKEFQEWYELMTFHAMLYRGINADWRENHEKKYHAVMAKRKAAAEEAKLKAKAERDAKRVERESKKQSSEPVGERSNADSISGTT